MSLRPTAPAVPHDSLAQLGQCPDGDALAACLKGRPEFLQPAVVEQLAEAVRQQVRVDVAEALRLAEAALVISTQIGDAGSLGRGHRAKANALWFKGDLRAAVALFEKAVAHFEVAGMREEIGRTLSSCIQSLALLGEYQRALQAAGRAREIFESINDPWRLARLEINVANIYHRQDRFAEALASYERAYEQLMPYKDAEASAVALHNVAVCLIMLDDFERALKAFRRARDLCERNQMPLLAAQADYNVAYLYFLRGDYSTAIQGLRTTRELCRQTGDAQHAALCDLNQSEIYVELNLAAEGAHMAQQAEAQFNSLGMALEAGRSAVNLAIAMHQQNESGKALELFGKAADVFAREKNEGWQALVRLYRALVLFETGEADRATRLCTEALEFFESCGLDRRATLCRLLLGRLSEAAGRFAEARVHAELALQKLSGAEAPILEYHVHVLLGHVQRSSGETVAAYRSYQQALANLERLRSSLQGEELKIAFMKDRLTAYESLVGMCMQSDRSGAAEEAFGYMEQAKSRNLTELVYGRGNPLPWRQAEGQSRERILSLRHELNWYYRRIEIEQTRAEGISPARINSLRLEARAREDELLRIVRELPSSSDPDLDFSAPGTVTLDEIRSALGPKATLVEYFQTGSELLAAVLTVDELRIARLGHTSEVANILRSLDFQLSKPALKQFRRKTFEQSLLDATQSRLHQLYQRLVAPIANWLKGRHLVIVPHGALHYLPFHALWDGSLYLIDRFTVSYAPSATIYALLQRPQTYCGGDSLLLGVGDRKTPWIQEEIRSVAAVVPNPQVRTGRQATADVLKTCGPSCRVIHIATHGIFRRDNPMFSSVRLADAYLSMYDLYQLRLPVDLLTLSGCGTGLSVVAAGDELLGLMRGLLSAGAQSLLLTLWDVHDRSTSEFMACFYKSLNRQNKASALREAMLYLREQHAHPYFWAPFILVGKDFSGGR